MFDMSINRVNKDTFLIGIFLYMLPYFYSISGVNKSGNLSLLSKPNVCKLLYGAL